jgi:glycosyltransferase involved in cell wall biosynthesis
MKLCFVVQRYGAEVAGGAELHCRWLAERLAQDHDVRVLTTCARDYIEWRNELPEGEGSVGGVPVIRYPVRRQRSQRRFGKISDIVFTDEHTDAEERLWVEENGPVAPELVRAIPRQQDVDLFVFYCYRYYHTFFGLPQVAERSVLVPTAEDDPAVRLRIFGELFRAPKGLVYLTPEERDLVQQVSGNGSLAHVVVGSGLNLPAGWREVDARSRFDLPERFLIYVGRIDRNKGVARLLDYYLWLDEESEGLPPLMLVGHPELELPDHPKLRHLGYVSEEEKFALLDAAELLLMPSPFESLSMVALEAWAMGRPVLANAACKVLEGQCLRSGGGLYYSDYAEFRAALRTLIERPELRRRLGEGGRAFVGREYDWQLVERRTTSFFEELSGAGEGRAGAEP